MSRFFFLWVASAIADIRTYRKPSFACAETRCNVIESEHYCFVVCENLATQSVSEDFLFAEADANLTVQAVPWNLDRIDQRKPELDLLPYSVSLRAVRDPLPAIFLFDTGVEPSHREFQWSWPRRNPYKRIVLYDFVNENNGKDAHGHGTHCAGIVGGKSTGVHPFSVIHSMKVVDKYGKAAMSTILGALVTAQKIASGPSVFSLSLGGPKSRALELLLEEIGMRHIVVVAAGNNRGNACDFSPSGAGGNGRASGVFTVGSVGLEDVFSAFSNHGKCVDILAPGSAIFSASLNNSYAYMSGTSMATPHVAGVAALLLQRHSWNLTRAREAVVDSATNLAINVPKDTTKKMIKAP